MSGLYSRVTSNHTRLQIWSDLAFETVNRGLVCQCSELSHVPQLDKSNESSESVGASKQALVQNTEQQLFSINSEFQIKI